MLRKGSDKPSDHSRALLRALSRLDGVHGGAARMTVGELLANLYILAGRKPIAATTLLEWGKFMESAECRVALTEHGAVTVSTKFLGFDHSFGRGPPLVFESMVFGGEHDRRQRRYPTWGEAQAGHAALCAEIFPK